MADVKNNSILPGGRKKTAKKQTANPRTVQETLPWLECYENGVFQVEPGRFTKTYEFGDISFKTKSEEEQQNIYEDYQKFLNVIRPNEDAFITIMNYKENDNSKLKSILPSLTGDEYDVYRKEITDMITDKLSQSRNNITTRKFITVRVDSDSVDDAMQKIRSSGLDIETAFRRCTKQSLADIELPERLEILNTILNGTKEINYWFEHDKDGSVKVDLGRMARQGLTTKDIISPEFIKFSANNIQLGEERYAQTLYLDTLPNWINSNFLAELSELNFETLITIHINSMPQEEAVKFIHNRSVNIDAEIIQRQKSNRNNNISTEFLPADLKSAKEHIELLQEDLMNRDQKIFFVSLLVTHFADTAEELKEQGKTIKNVGAKFMSNIKPMMMQQERGFMSSLPIGLDRTYVKRLLTTESLGVIVPFDEVNQFDKGGFYYGINQINKSLIIYNRLKGQNYNGLVLGASGSGKSFSAKREMTNAIINTNAEVYIIDPDGEYAPMAKAFNGSVIKIEPGNGVYINPFDLDIDTSNDEENSPLVMKTDFICGMLETMLGGSARLLPSQKSIVDRCVKIIYHPYIQHLQELPPDPKTGRKRTIDRDTCPTMQSLFEALLQQPQQEAQELALVMETYTTGAFDTFAHRTNVDLDNRLIIYDISKIGTNLMELALKVCMNDCWNKMMENKRQNKWTWFYIDEFHLLLSNASTSNFLKSVWKRARKWQGVPTGITQNVEDLLQSQDARAIINNSSFVYMLNQSAMDRSMLAELLNLTENDVEFITNAEAGHGLIYTGKQSIPFSDKFPKNTKLFEVMTTKPKDVEE